MLTLSQPDAANAEAIAAFVATETSFVFALMTNAQPVPGTFVEADLSQPTFTGSANKVAQVIAAVGLRPDGLVEAIFPSQTWKCTVAPVVPEIITGVMIFGSTTVNQYGVIILDPPVTITNVNDTVEVLPKMIVQLGTDSVQNSVTAIPGP